jgi:protein arginine kinase activator
MKMLCDNCKNNPASVHMVSVVNGVKNEQHLCAKCAQELNKNMLAPFNMGDIPFGMGDMFQPVEGEKKCSTCGMSADYLRRSGKLGCAQCYKDLRSELTPALRRMHGRTQHVGREPLLEPEDQAAREKKRKLEAMQGELETAIEQEQYEKAALLRDEIKQLREGA